MVFIDGTIDGLTRGEYWKYYNVDRKLLTNLLVWEQEAVCLFEISF